jgi:hypothetical protein
MEGSTNKLTETKASLKKFIEDCINLNAAYHDKHIELLRIFETFKLLYERYNYVREEIGNSLKSTMDLITDASNQKLDSQELDKLLKQQRDALVQVQQFEQGISEIAGLYKDIFNKEILGPIDRILMYDTQYVRKNKITYKTPKNVTLNIFTDKEYVQQLESADADTDNSEVGKTMSQDEIDKNYEQMKRMFITGRKLLEYMLYDHPFLIKDSIQSLLLYTSSFSPLIHLKEKSRGKNIYPTNHGLCLFVDKDRVDISALQSVLQPEKDKDVISYAKKITSGFKINIDGTGEKTYHRVEINIKYYPIMIIGNVFCYPTLRKIQFPIYKLFQVLESIPNIKSNTKMYLFKLPKDVKTEDEDTQLNNPANYIEITDADFIISNNIANKVTFENPNLTVNPDDDIDFLWFTDYKTIDEVKKELIKQKQETESGKINYEYYYTMFTSYKKYIHDKMKDRSMVPPIRITEERRYDNITSLNELVKNPVLFLDFLEQAVEK